MRAVAIVNAKDRWPSGLEVGAGERVAYVIFPDLDGVPQQVDVITSGLRSGTFQLRNMTELNQSELQKLCDKFHSHSRSPEEQQEELAMRRREARQTAVRETEEAASS